MKLLLTALFILYFTGIGCEVQDDSEKTGSNTTKEAKNKESEQKGAEQKTAEQKTVEQSIADPLFTITHKSTDGEYVLVYLRTNEDFMYLLSESPRTYRLKPSQCLKVRKSQFPYLGVVLEKGGGSAELFHACGDNNTPKCQPNHYEIVNLKKPWSIRNPDTYFSSDQFALVPAVEPNQSELCVEIETWIKWQMEEQL